MTADSELSGLGTARDCTKPHLLPTRGEVAAQPPRSTDVTDDSEPLPIHGEGKGRAHRMSTDVTTTIAITRPAKGGTARVYSPRATASPRHLSCAPSPMTMAATRKVIPKKRANPIASSDGGGTNRVVKSPQ